MLNPIKLKKKSVMFTWFLSYLLVLVLPLLMGSVTYYEADRIIQNTTNQSSAAILRGIQQRADDLLVSMERLTTEIIFNTRIQNISKMRRPFSSDHLLNIYNVSEELKGYNTSYYFIDHMYIYFADNDLVIAPMVSNDSKRFYETYYSPENITYEEWSNFLESKHVRKYITVETKDGNVVRTRNIIYVRTVPTFSGFTGTVNIAMSVEQTKFTDIAANVEQINKGVLVILDNDDNIVAASKTVELPDDIKYQSIQGDDGWFNSKVGGDNVVVSHISSDVTDWKYIYITPQNIFWSKMNYFRIITLIISIISMVLGFVIILYLVRKNYSPLKQLVHTISAEQPLNTERHLNEYQYIQHSISQTLNEKERMAHILQQQSEVLKTDFLVRIIKGRDIGKTPLNQLLSTYNIKFTSDYFTVMCFYINNIDDIFFEKQQSDSAQDLKLARFIIGNVFEELIGNKNKAFVLEVEDSLVCLININVPDEVRTKKELLKISKEAQEFIREEFNISCMVAIGGVHQTLRGIPTAYTEAIETMEYKVVMQNEEIFEYGELPDLPKATYYYPIEKEQQLINCIKSGDYSKAERILDEIFETNFEKTLLPIQVAKCLMFDLVSTMLKTINEMSMVCEKEFIEQLNPVEKLFACETVTMMKSEMTDILKKFCEYIDERNRKNKKNSYQLKDRIYEFIEKYYHDVNLNVASIAKHFEMHPTYVSRAFKEQTGEGLLNYINKIRIEKSKILISTTKKSLEEIAAEVGYSSFRTFIRVFTKIVGTTPGKYKEIPRNNQNENFPD